MKRFKLAAIKLTELSYRLNQMTPEQIAKTLPEVNAVEANRVKKKVVKKINQANHLHWDEVNRIANEKNVIVQKYEDEYKAKDENMSAEQVTEFGKELTIKRGKEMDAVQATTKSPDYALTEVDVSLGDDDYQSLQKLIVGSMPYWVTSEGRTLSDLLVEVSDAIDAAEDET